MTDLEDRTSNYLKRLVFLREIGRGSYGIIYEAMDQRTGKTFAIKEICIYSEEMLDSAINETGLAMKHKNILNYSVLLASERPATLKRLKNDNSINDSFESSELNSQVIYNKLAQSNILYHPRENTTNKYYLYLRMNLCAFSLREFVDFRNSNFFQAPEINLALKKTVLADEKAISTFETSLGIMREIPLAAYIYSVNVHSSKCEVNRQFLYFVFKHIINGLVYIHSNGITHGDIKPSNILFVKDGVYVPKISDFGLMEKIGDNISTDTQKSSFGSCSLQKKSYKVYEDLKEAGIMYYEMLCPFKTGMERTLSIREVRKKGRLPAEFIKKFPCESNVIDACLNGQRKRKISARTIQRMLQNFSFR